MRKQGWFLLFGLVAFLASISWSVSGSGRLGTSSDGVLAQAQPFQAGFESKKIVPFVPTPQDVVERMLEMAQVKEADVLYDLGSGDGRIVITAAKKYGVRAIGFEIDPDLIRRSRENIKKEGLTHLAEIREQDILTVDLSPATVVTMYLLPSVNMRLRPIVWSQLRPGARVVSHDFDMGDWRAERVVNVNDSSGGSHSLYLWRIGEQDRYR